MTTISASAAFEGLRLARRRPMAILVWSVVWLAVSAVGEYAVLRIGGETLARLGRLDVQDRPDPREVLALYANPLMAGLLLLFLVFYAVISAGAYRVELRRPQPARPLGLGADEARQIVLMVVVLATVFVANFLALLILGLTAGAANLASPVLAGVVVGLGSFLVLGVTVYVMVRLSLAGPETLDRARVAPFDSWRLTKGLFWKLFGVYALSFLLCLVVACLGLLVTGVLAALIGGPQAGSTAGILSPGRLVYLIGTAGISALTFAIISAPPALIYRQITHPSTQD